MTPLHHFGEALRQALSAIPLEVVRLVFVSLPLALLVWVLFLPRDWTTPPEPDRRRWGSNLKFGAALALLLQIVIYWLL